MNKYVVTMEITISDEMANECYNRMIFSSKNPSTKEVKEKIETYMENGIFDINSINVTKVNDLE